MIDKEIVAMGGVGLLLIVLLVAFIGYQDSSFNTSCKATCEPLRHNVLGGGYESRKCYCKQPGGEWKLEFPE